MQGIILAAGKGTRLAPLTHVVPKALVKINGMTLLDVNLRKLLSAGVCPIVINLHTFSRLIKQHVLFHYDRDDILFSEEPFEILGTGGGIVQAASFLSSSDAVLVHNVDVLSDLDLKRLFEAYSTTNADVLLVVKKRHSSRELLFDLPTMEWLGWRRQNEQLLVKSSSHVDSFGFCGISLFNTQLLHRIKERGYFSFIHLLELLYQMGAQIKAFPIQNAWMDAGKLVDLKLARQFLEKQ
jgi:NDP-sugar pyrophosphorylase family protein